MSDEPDPGELHTEADDIPPLSPRESESMGRQTEGAGLGRKTGAETIYGDVDGSAENEDQTQAHHAESDEHV